MQTLQEKVEQMLDAETKRRDVALRWIGEVTDILSGNTGNHIWGTPATHNLDQTGAVTVWTDTGMETTTIYFRYQPYQGLHITEYPGFYVSENGYLLWGRSLEEIKGRPFWEYVGKVLAWVEELAGTKLEKMTEKRDAIVKRLNPIGE